MNPPRKLSVGFFLPLPLCTSLTPARHTADSLLCPGLQISLWRHGISLLYPILPFLAGQQIRLFTGPQGDRYLHQELPKHLWEGAPSCLPPARLSPGPLTGVLISGSGPLVPALPGTGLSPAPLQSPSDRSLLLPLLVGCSWCHRCAGLGKRRGSDSAPAPVAQWPRTAAQDREGKVR